MTELGTLPGDDNSGALGINDAGHVVGWSGRAEGSASRAILWQKGRILNLNDLLQADSPWVLTRATDINDAGRIVGTGLNQGQVRAVLLVPRRET